tara:strand:- start:160 stop:294 length:135 start_codon:yes stop_codon:yes gene_type:complete
MVSCACGDTRLTIAAVKEIGTRIIAQAQTNATADDFKSSIIFLE